MNDSSGSNAHGPCSNCALSGIHDCIHVELMEMLVHRFLWAQPLGLCLARHNVGIERQSQNTQHCADSIYHSRYQVGSFAMLVLHQSSSLGRETE